MNFCKFYNFYNYKNCIIEQLAESKLMSELNGREINFYILLIIVCFRGQWNIKQKEIKFDVKFPKHFHFLSFPEPTSFLHHHTLSSLHIGGNGLCPSFVWILCVMSTLTPLLSLSVLVPESDCQGYQTW